MKIKGLLTLLLFFAGGSSVFAQEIPVSPASPVVVELFSSQACAFCPKADEILSEISGMDGVIALACHVDYFDVKQGALSIPACTERQTQYVQRMSLGTHYTPQMVVNGHRDVIGYKAEEVSAALLKGRTDKVLPITVDRSEKGDFTLHLPELDTGGQGASLWLAVFDKPRTVTVAEGANRGKNMTYTNIVRRIEALDAWDGKAGIKEITPSLEEGSAGFAVFAQNPKTGEIISAGKILIP